MPKARKGREYYSYVDEWKTLWKPDMDALGGYDGQSCDPTRVDLKVIQWAKDHCANMPHFVKVINKKAALGYSTKHANCYMAVPVPFAHQHFRELDRVITLEDGEGRTWRVSFGTPRKQPTWSQGWDRFARDNDLKPGDVVVFVLLRKSCFRFTLFDADGNMRKKSTASSANADESALICKEEEESPGSSFWSFQDKLPSVSNRGSTEQNPKTKKRTFAVATDHLNTNQEAGYGGRDGSAPGNRHGHAEPNQWPVPAKKQTTEPPYDERKMQKTDEEFEAPCQNLDLLKEEKILKSKVESDTIAHTTSTKGALKYCADVDPYNPLQSSSVPTAPRDTSPLTFESFEPSAFTFKSKRRRITPLERQRAGDSAMAHAKNLTEHHFVSVMSETHIYRDFHLVLPDNFVAATGLPASPTLLKFLDCAGHSWDVYSKKNACNQFALHRKYWALFALHHLLEEGDVCVFALKENEPARSVLVHIFRVVPVSSCGRTSVHSHYETHEIEATQTCTPNN